MAAPGVNGKLLVALSKYGTMKPADLIEKLQRNAKPEVKCSLVPCAPVTVPSTVPSTATPEQCDDMMTT
jgi:hypothetical protein